MNYKFKGVLGIIEHIILYLLISAHNSHKLLSTMEKVSLKRLRGSLRLTQRQLAQEAQISEKAFADIERGKARPRPITAHLIVEALNKKLKEAKREEITVDSLDWNPL